jgi:hypothetical protein
MEKKKWMLPVLVVMMFFATSEVSAQLRFGIKGGYNIASVKFNKDVLKSDNVDGFQLGPVLEFMIPGSAVGFDFGVLYTRKGFFSKEDDTKFTNDYIEVPVNLKLKLGLPLVSPYFAAGPYVGFRVEGDRLKEIVVDNVKRQFEAKSFAAGLNFTAGVEVFNRVQVGLTYDWGLTDNYKTFDKNDTNQYRGKGHTWLLSAALFF